MSSPHQENNECTCPEFIHEDDRVDFIIPRKNGTYVLSHRFHKDCPVHGYKVIEDTNLPVPKK